MLKIEATLNKDSYEPLTYTLDTVVYHKDKAFQERKIIPVELFKSIFDSVWSQIGYHVKLEVAKLTEKKEE